MDGLMTMDSLMNEPCAQVRHATNDFCIAPRLGRSGAHSMDGLMTMDGLMKEPCAEVAARNKRLLYSFVLPNLALTAWTVSSLWTV